MPKLDPLEKEIRSFERWKYSMIAAKHNAKEAVKRVRRWRIKNYIPDMLRRARARARKESLVFNLRKEDLTIPEFCPVLGVRLGRSLGKKKETSPSLDKIIPELGYIKSNVQIISVKANWMKSNASPEELLKFAEWINKTYAATSLPTRSS